ncbi:hypothetical protein ILUMI_21135 [Ignelater luminosus]|uniref:ABC transporter domain-containing protein n=1 Tax=Ignelater luminosus TaxID=2038154 RepID=A0A8K0CF39_IGNLU|nr:hypothetical protein ILUMI_21135 [Ignelater luminosus]
MMGLRPRMLWLGWFIHSIVLNFLSILVITYLVKSTIFNVSYPAIEYCSTSVFAIFLLLYCASGITYCFLISTLFNKPTVAMMVAIIVWYIPDNILTNFINRPGTKLRTKMLCASIIPNTLMRFGYKEIAVYEVRQIGVSWGNLFKPASGATSADISMGVVFLMFVFTSTLFLVLTFYMENVKPGPYGLPKPLHYPIQFILQMFAQPSNRIEVIEDTELEELGRIESVTNLKPGIQIKNVCKKYGNQVVVNNLSIDIYEGLITVLLGHNGAGKTTTMSIITGMITTTSGRVLVNDLDIRYDMNKIRSYLGFCPQHNLQFSEFTVYEHLLLFGMLKGLSLYNAKREAMILLTHINLLERRNYHASKLSGGMRRKLSLGMALIGNSKVLILDEPTSGLDPEARREIWDILLTYRGSRTTLVTTHSMEEADVLGDRIAIMDHGRLVCYGSSMFLKKEYSTGYKLTITRDEEAYRSLRYQGGGTNQVTAITELVQGRVRNAKHVMTNGCTVVYSLPHDMKSYFGGLLETLESRKSDLCITHIALSVTTLDEVYLKVDKMVTKDRGSEDNSSYDHAARALLMSDTSAKCTGMELLKMQLRALFRKRWLALKRNWLFYVIATLVAICISIITLWIGKSDELGNQSVFDLSLSQYGKTTVVYEIENGATDFLTRAGQYYQKSVTDANSVINKVANASSEIIKKGIDNIVFYKFFMVVAAEFRTNRLGKPEINAMYGNLPKHGAPISLNLVMNAILKTVMNGDYSILISNSPLPIDEKDKAKQDLSETDIMILWVFFFPFGILFLTGTFLMFPLRERTSHIKQLQLMCGVRAIFYWMVSFIFDFALFAAAVFLILVCMFFYGIIQSNELTGVKQLGVVMAILLAYGVAVIPHVYLFSYRKTIGGAFSVYVMCSLFISILLTAMVVVKAKEGYQGIRYILLLYPHLGLTVLLINFSVWAVRNYNWDIKREDEKKEFCMFQKNPCCAGDHTQECIEYRSYFKQKPKAVGTSTMLLIMASSTILYFTILLLLETNFVRKIWERLLIAVYNIVKKPRRASVDEDTDDVKVEERRIAEVLQQEERLRDRYHQYDPNQDTLLVHNVEKAFLRHRVLKGINLAVKPGECFGLLGVNGAGKTTTFRVLTGNLPLTKGEARIVTSSQKRVYLSKHSKEYLREVGYCPQFEALNEILTGREMLELFADLRGIQEGADEEINMWFKALGFEEHADKQCGVYSGGNKRKLNVAIALIGGLPVVMLDEPTSGVDPVSRRKLWNTIIAIQKKESKPSIVLTSHSMEECEALCNKLAIMKSGKLQCYGTIPNIKNKYATGFTVMLKIKQSRDDTSSRGSKDSDKTTSTRQSLSVRRRSAVTQYREELNILMIAFQEKYKGYCTLKDQYTGFLHYHISDKSKKWGQIFKEIEQLQYKHPIIEDYNISETSLEEVFLSIARLEH